MTRKKVAALLETIGYIVIYAGSNSIDSNFYKRAINRNIRFRGFGENKLKIITSTETEKPKFEFWLSKDGAKPTVKEKNFNLLLPTEKVLSFADDLIEVVNIGGKKSFYSISCDAGCVTFADFGLLSVFMKANPDLNSFVIVHANNLNQANQVRKILLKEIETVHNRLKFFYGGKNKNNSNKFFEIEIYLAKNESRLQQLKLKSYKPLN